ncbi:AraC family transcriptional regulator [Rubritalea marina]|uniref:AraC family transcriptional regulator n=1 Tax=Rubritalea marina TaxID=361055 RepID=UPI0014615B2B|nr:helix-turn-helix domain-containing protein [Rubritalea marina]
MIKDLNVTDINEEEVEEFLDALRPGQISLVLFQAMPDVMFWIKNSKGEFIYFNDAFRGHLRIKPQVGMRDCDMVPVEMAQVYMQDDQTVMETDQSIWNKVELVVTATDGVEWRATSKVPLKNRDGMVVGTAGISRRVGLTEGVPLPSQQRDMAAIVGAIYKSVDKDIKVSKIAESVGLSVSSLERLFKANMNTTPKQFIIQAKVSTACERLIGTQMSVKEIGVSVGYSDHANFTRGFRKVMNMSPSMYRRTYRRQ